MTLQGSTQEQLRQMIESIERLEEEKSGIGADIKDKYLEAKGLGFDTKILKQIIKLRKMDANEREEEDSILHTYMAALGMLPEND